MTSPATVDTSAAPRRKHAPGVDRRKAIVAFIAEFTAEHRFPPTVREIGAAVGHRSPASVNYLLGKLEEEGVLTRQPAMPRSLVLVEPTPAEVDPVDEADRCGACGGTGRAGTA
jgi:SOS-response transcriptional repressor LexA